MWIIPGVGPARPQAEKPPGAAMLALKVGSSASACSRVTPARRRYGPTGWLGWPRSAPAVPPCVHDTLLGVAAAERTVSSESEEAYQTIIHRCSKQPARDICIRYEKLARAARAGANPTWPAFCRSIAMVFGGSHSTTQPHNQTHPTTPQHHTQEKLDPSVTHPTQPFRRLSLRLVRSLGFRCYIGRVLLSIRA